MAGCAGQKKHKQVVVGLPINCITGAELTAECRQISDSLAVCNGMIVKFACIKALKADGRQGQK